MSGIRKQAPPQAAVTFHPQVPRALGEVSGTEDPPKRFPLETSRHRNPCCMGLSFLGMIDPGEINPGAIHKAQNLSQDAEHSFAQHRDRHLGWQLRCEIKRSATKTHRRGLPFLSSSMDTMLVSWDPSLWPGVASQHSRGTWIATRNLPFSCETH